MGKGKIHYLQFKVLFICNTIRHSFSVHGNVGDWPNHGVVCWHPHINHIWSHYICGNREMPPWYHPTLPHTQETIWQIWGHHNTPSAVNQPQLLTHYGNPEWVGGYHLIRSSLPYNNLQASLKAKLLTDRHKQVEDSLAVSQTVLHLMWEKAHVEKLQKKGPVSCWGNSPPLEWKRSY